MKLLVLLIFLPLSLFSQGDSTEIANFFQGYLDKEARAKFLEQALPTYEECQYVFKPEYVDQFYKYIQDLPPVQLKVDEKEYVTCSIRSHIVRESEDIHKRLTGGIYWSDTTVNNNIELFTVRYLRNESATYGLRYSNFVYINGRWVFFPKPWRAFKD